MIIDAKQAQNICVSVAVALRQQADSLRASFQGGGVERKIEGWVQRGLSCWLLRNRNDLELKGHDLVCLSEYRGLDFVFAHRGSIGENRIVVDTLFEAKFNYTSQRGELKNRPARASVQIRDYLENHKLADGYVIYVTAVPDRSRRICKDSDNGWRYTRADNISIYQAHLQLKDSAAKAGLNCLAKAISAVSGWRYGIQLFELQKRTVSASIQH